MNVSGHYPDALPKHHKHAIIGNLIFFCIAVLGAFLTFVIWQAMVRLTCSLTCLFTKP